MSIKPLGLLHLYRVRLRARLVQELFALIGIAAGVALLFASQVANTSLNGSVKQLTTGLIGDASLQLKARGDEGFPQSTLGEVQRLPGVRSAAPVVEATVSVIGPKGRRNVELIGADPRFVHLGGRLLRRFGAAALGRQRAFALPTPLAEQVGGTSLEVLKIASGERTVPALLGTTLGEAEIGALVHSPVALAPLNYVQQLTERRGDISRIFVASEPGRESEVKAALKRLAGGRLNVEPADYDATLFANAAKPTNESTELFAAISALVGFLFAFNAMLMTAPARRAFISGMLTDGYSPWAMLEVLLLDAAVLGVTASVVGLVLGEELSIHLFHTSPGYLSFAFAVGSQRIVTITSIAVSAGGGLLAAFVGVLAPLHDQFIPRPSWPSSLKRLASGVRLVGAGCLIATGAILMFSPQAAVIGVLCLTVALLALLPTIVSALLSSVASITDRVRAVAPLIAVSELRAAWSRTIGIAATGAVAVFGSVAIQGAHADLQRGLDGSARDVSSPAAVWVYPPGLSNLLATTPFRPRTLTKIAQLPDVQEVWSYRSSFLDYGQRRVWVSAQPGSQPQMVFSHQLVEGRLPLVDRRVREGGWAVISRAIAAEHHLHIGSAFTLPSPRPIRLRVAGLSTNVGWPPGAILIDAGDYVRGWDSQDISAYEIIPRPGASVAAVAHEVQNVLGPDSGLAVQTAEQREQRSQLASRQGLSRLTQIATLVLIADALAMAAAIGNMIAQRRFRLARLKLDGFSDLAVWRSLLLESLLLVASGCTAGALFGLYGQLLGSRAILSVTGFPMIFSFALPVALASLGAVTALAVAITAIPGLLVARTRPATGLTS